MTQLAQRAMPAFSRATLRGSGADDWETPDPFFAVLDREFHFTLDAAASEGNAKCSPYFTRDDDGLARDWGTETVWLNPPYGRETGHWIRKAWEASQLGATVVSLIPVSSDTGWWHRYVMQASEIRFVEGRIRFSGSRVNAPFPCAVAVFRPGQEVCQPLIRTWPR